MKNNSIIILLAGLLMILSLYSCTKSKKNMDRTLTGRIIVDSTNAPLSNTALKLFASGYSGGTLLNRTYMSDEFSFATDANGYFSVVFNTIYGYTLEIGYPDDKPRSGNNSPFWLGSIGSKESSKDVGEIRIK